MEMFSYGKKKLFSQLTDDTWTIKPMAKSPIISTLRELTLAEQEDPKNRGVPFMSSTPFKGVRTYYFLAF